MSAQADTRRKAMDLHDRDAEREVLSAAFTLRPEDARAVLAKVPAEAWSLERHRYLAEAMAALCDRGIGIEPAMLRQELIDAGQWEACGAMSGLSQMLDPAGAVYNAGEYAKRVVRKGLERQLLAAWQGGVGDVVEGYVEASAERAQAIGEIMGKLRDLDAQEVTSADKLAAHMERMRNPEQRTVYATGIRTLDDSLDGGLSPGHVCVVLGEPNKGKTALVGGITATMMQAGGAVLAFSEMDGEEMLARWFAGQSGLPLRAQKRGDLTDWQWGLAANASDRMARWEWSVRPVMPFVAMANEARAYKRKHPSLAAIVVDYLQLVDNGCENRVQDIERTTRGFKLLAAELGVVVFELSQPDKASAKSGELGMSSSRGASSIEADCDLLIIPIRDEADPSRAGLKMAKWKHGPKRDLELGTLRFNGARMVFEEA